MNRTKVVQAIIDMELVGGHADPEDAISYIATLIDELDMHDDNYAQEMNALLSVGACIWHLQRLLRA